MPPTDHQRGLRRHIAADTRHEADPVITIGEDHVGGDCVFGMAECLDHVRLYRLDKDAGDVNQFHLFGESATLAMLALTRLR